MSECMSNVWGCSQSIFEASVPGKCELPSLGAGMKCGQGLLLQFWLSWTNNGDQSGLELTAVYLLPPWEG